MENGQPVTIRKVANGFIVEPPTCRYADYFVFENFGNMAAWLEKHFTPIKVTASMEGPVIIKFPGAVIYEEKD